MLVELQIRDFAIVERLTVPFSAGLNVLTGETGAGKSIVIDALGAVLGARTGGDVVRTGAASARVEAAFDQASLAEGVHIRLSSLLTELGLDDDEVIVLTREITASGRSSARVGGRLVPVGTLQRIGALLVDIHGQHEHLSLLKPAEQLDVLDRYAGTTTLRAEVAAAVNRIRAIRRELGALLADEREVARRVDLLQFQIEEIDAARLQPNEDEDLANEQRLLGSAERLAALAAEGYEALGGGRDGLAEASGALRQIAAIDESAGDLARLAADLAEQADDLLRDIRSYRDNVEFNPERLSEVEARISLLATLQRKYGATVDDVLRFRQAAADELGLIESSAERRESLGGEIRQELERLADLAAQLSTARQAAADRIAREVEAELGDLGFGRARFAVDLRQIADPDGVTAGGETVQFDETGIDRVEFLLAANPGDPPRPLGRVASGGETSRILLALKSVLGRADPVPTLVFDEVDVGIGGRTGNIVGQKLWALSSSHQVLCITHLPSVASFADHHLSVVKQTEGERAGVAVRVLESELRRVELANMLGGHTRTTEESAAELLDRAAGWKQGTVV